MTAAAKRPILAGLSYGINVGSSFCGPQVAGLALLAALWMSDILPIPFEEPSGPTTPSFTNARQITSAVGVEDFPTWSPDGQTLAYESDQSGNMDIWVQQIGGGPPVNRTPDSEWRESNPSWSPDGSSISFLSQREERAYYTMSALGGEARKVVNTFESAMYSGPLWLSGGKELAGLGEDGNALDILALDTRQTRQVVLPVRAAGTADWSWSPDGRLLAGDVLRSLSKKKMYGSPNSNPSPELGADKENHTSWERYYQVSDCSSSLRNDWYSGI